MSHLQKDDGSCTSSKHSPLLWLQNPAIQSVKYIDYSFFLRHFFKCREFSSDILEILKSGINIDSWAYSYPNKDYPDFSYNKF